jgi:hypothetical protein
VRAELRCHEKWLRNGWVNREAAFSLLLSHEGYHHCAALHSSSGIVHRFDFSVLVSSRAVVALGDDAVDLVCRGQVCQPATIARVLQVPVLRASGFLGLDAIVD